MYEEERKTKQKHLCVHFFIVIYSRSSTLDNDQLVKLLLKNMNI